MIIGSCLCAGVRYEINGKFGPALNCHCSMFEITDQLPRFDGFPPTTVVGQDGSLPDS
jgi:hypothetical protein